MQIAQIDTYLPTLPFRFSFAHGLASRSESQNLVVRVRLTNGKAGFGEGIARDYVTGESAQSARDNVCRVFAPRLAELDFNDCQDALLLLSQVFCELGLDLKKKGAAWCALELAVLDALGQSWGLALPEFWGGSQRRTITYGAVAPLCRERAFVALLMFYKLYGFQTVKIKVGADWQENIKRLALARKVLGEKITLRVDVNSVSDAESVLKASAALTALNVVSIEQPVKASDFAGLAKIRANIAQEVVVDESLCTIADAKELIERKACSAFNIRLSKVGGLLAARQIAALARQANINCHMGAQVGESGILSQAGRIFACLEEPMQNYEGSDNAFLLRHDLTVENLTVGPGGKGKLNLGPGLGLNVLSERLGAPQSINFSRSLVREAKSES